MSKNLFLLSDEQWQADRTPFADESSMVSNDRMIVA